MDNLTLHALYLDFRDRLMGCRVEAVESPQTHFYLFRFNPPLRPALVLSVHPDLAGLLPLYRMPKRRAPTSGSHAALLHHVLAGTRLVAAEKQFPERIVTFRFTGENRDQSVEETMLVAEFLGRSANLVLLRPGGVVAGTARALGSEFRPLRTGDTYVPPPARDPGGSRWRDPDECLAALRAEAHTGDVAESIFRRHAPALFGLCESHRGIDPRQYLDQVLTGYSNRDFRPVLYLAGIPANPDAAVPIDRKTAILSPCPAPLPIEVEHLACPDIREGGARLLDLMFRHRRFLADRAAIRRAATREVKKISRLRRDLESDRQRVSDPEPLRHRAEALLAGLSGARVEGGCVRVADPYDQEGGELKFDLPDPGKGLADNAAILFHRYRRAQRGRVRIEQRLTAIQPRAAALADLAGLALNCRTESELRVLEDRLGEMGIVRPTAVGRGPRPRRSEFRSLRRVTSPDGWIVYIGRNATENQELTFRIASEWDFWFHAAGVSGSHVVARNPKRKGTIPEPTLRLAAAAAAWYSGARGGGPVEVHYALRRQLRKGKSPGQVLIKRYRSLRIEPADPLAEDA
jgi:predicted ribosome quality control (RQC) complex YloA/Tae2 family protein